MLTTGCVDILGIPVDPIVCYNFCVFDDSIVAEPPDAFPDQPFVLTWEDKTDAPPEVVPNLVERLSLANPDDGTDVITLPDRVVPWAPNQFSSVDFAEFLAARGSSPRPTSSASRWARRRTAWRSVRPSCTGRGSWTTSPGSSPWACPANVTGGTPTACASRVQPPPGAPGKLGPIAFPLPSMLSGTSSTQTISSESVLPTTRADGTYNVTVALDPDGSVAECPSNPDDQVAVFSYTVP